MIIGIAGALVGVVCRVQTHPKGMQIWLADVSLGDNTTPVQIVFGGDYKLAGGELVPVAPPGSWATERRLGIRDKRKKMRVRNYRGERSHGMLCSLDELGWIRGGPNEVAILCDVEPGQSLDGLPRYRRPEVVVGWERAKLMEKMARTHLTGLFDPLAEATCCDDRLSREADAFSCSLTRQ